MLQQTYWLSLHASSLLHVQENEGIFGSAICALITRRVFEWAWVIVRLWLKQEDVPAMSIGTELEHFMEYVFGFCAALDEAFLQEASHGSAKAVQRKEWHIFDACDDITFACQDNELEEGQVGLLPCVKQVLWSNVFFGACAHDHLQLEELAVYLIRQRIALEALPRTAFFTRRSAFRRVKWGEWLVYHDASRYVQEGFSSSVQPLLDWLESHQNENPCQCLPAVRLRQSFEHEWLQQCVPPYGTAPVPSDQAADVFCGLMQKLGTCRPREPNCCAWNWHQSTLQHAWSVWRKNRLSAKFLREWALQAEDYDNIASLPFLWNQGVYQHQLLFLVDPEIWEVEKSGGLAWRSGWTSPDRWQRSLCAQKRPSLAARPVGASVFIKTGDSMVPLSGKWKPLDTFRRVSATLEVDNNSSSELSTTDLTRTTTLRLSTSVADDLVNTTATVTTTVTTEFFCPLPLAQSLADENHVGKTTLSLSLPLQVCSSTH
eukprot:g13501.t1